MITRSCANSLKAYDLPCCACGYYHQFDQVCSAMVEMSPIPPMDLVCPYGRSQCERSCWCERREWVDEYNNRKRIFLNQRNSKLTKELDLPRDREPSRGFAGRVMPQPMEHPATGNMLLRRVNCVGHNLLQVFGDRRFSQFFSDETAQVTSHSTGGL